VATLRGGDPVEGTEEGQSERREGNQESVVSWSSRKESVPSRRGQPALQ
jgi:hypothetical protein